MRVLVTGHEGYIGTVLVPMLLKERHEVVGLDSGLFKECTFLSPVPIIPGFKKDIRNIQVSDLIGFDAVVHLAGLSNDPLGNLDPELTGEINHEASVRLARMAKEMKITRFIFASSCSIYGQTGEETVDEEADFKPVTPYGLSKIMAENDLRALANAHFSPTFIRSATAYGVSPRLRFDLVLNNLVAWAVTTGFVRLKSDGTPWRPVVHVEDIARAYTAVLSAPREVVHNQAFNVGSTNENYRISQLAEIVKEIVPGSHIEYAAGARPDKRQYRVDCSKMGRTFPDFQPRWDARRGARQLFETYLRAGLSQEEFEGSRYSRIAHLKQLLRTGLLDDTLRWKNENAEKVRTMPPEGTCAL